MPDVSSPPSLTKLIRQAQESYLRISQMIEQDQDADAETQARIFEDYVERITMFTPNTNAQLSEKISFAVYFHKTVGPENLILTKMLLSIKNNALNRGLGS